MRSNRGQIRSLEACWSLEVTSGHRPPKMHMSSYEVTWDHKGFHAKFGSEMTPFFAPVPPRHFLTFATCASFLLALLFAQHCLFAWTSVTLIMPYRNDL